MTADLIAPPGFVAVRGRAGIVKYERVAVPPPAPRPADWRKKTCSSCPTLIDYRHERCWSCHRASLSGAGHRYEVFGPEVDELMAVLEWNLARHDTPLASSVCDDCGCLLAHAYELCPSCTLPWVRANAVAPFPVIYYQTEQQAERRAA